MTSTQRILAHEVTGVIISGHCMPARITLSFDPTDAHAITLDLKTKRRHPSPQPDTWLLSREMLAQGLTHTAGTGDARLRPLTEDWILLDLGAQPPTMLIMARPDLRAFLDESYHLVPHGIEAATIDWDSFPR